MSRDEINLARAERALKNGRLHLMLEETRAFSEAYLFKSQGMGRKLVQVVRKYYPPVEEIAELERKYRELA